MTQEEYLKRVAKVLGIELLSEAQVKKLTEIYDDVKDTGWEVGHQQGYENGYYLGRCNAEMMER